MTASSDPTLPRVLVVGAGMAGLAAERALSRAAVDIRIIDAHNYTTFPPLLFQVATCFLAPTDVVRPVRGVLRGRSRTSFVVGEVVDVDWSERRVVLADGSCEPFDFLVLAPGVVPAFGVPGAAENAIPLKSVADARRLRNQLLRLFERASAHPDAACAADTSIVVVGGGPTGVELSGYVAELLFRRQFTADYPLLDPAAMRVTLVERGDTLIPLFHPALRGYALTALRKRGVDARLGVSVVRVDAGGVELSSGERIAASTVVWAGGVEAPEWIRRIGLPIEEGRVVVEPDLRVPGRADTFAVGDVAAMRAPSGTMYSQLAQVAIQSGRHAGRQVGALASGRPTTPFSYFDKGQMAIIGRNAAVVQARRLRLSGRLAWVAWGFLHVGYLPSAIDRMVAGLKYIWWHVTHENADRVLLEDEPALGARPAVARGEPGQPGRARRRRPGPRPLLEESRRPR